MIDIGNSPAEVGENLYGCVQLGVLTFVRRVADREAAWVVGFNEEVHTLDYAEARAFLRGMGAFGLVVLQRTGGVL